SAARLGRVVRSSDLVARYGGEEFVVVAPDCEIRAAVKLAERFRTAIAELGVVEHGVTIPVTTSVGVAATSDLARIPPAELLKQADEALYRAKDSGRDATWYWDRDRGPLAAAELLRDGES
ncbi:MAG TPA: GGDEF domain-containing protein, partial [Isosphaeraceae bacterium]|nr:GGDEF domain-containing protein [Isosphaeraceae bacterium]